MLAKVVAVVGEGRATLLKLLSNHLSNDEQHALAAALPAPSKDEKPISRVERIEKLSAQFELPKVSVYILERAEEDAAGTEVGRSGGTPLGVSENEWPKHHKKPMEHVLTLDLAAMEDLRVRRRLDAYRAVSVFVPDRQGGEHLDKGQVVMLTEEQVARGELLKGPPEEKSVRIKVTRVMVPEKLFEPSSAWGLEPMQEGTMRALHNALYQSPGRVLGLPFWLQSDPEEYDDGGPPGEFLMQFDDSLASINTGDGGLIYVFTGGVMMQCH